MKDSINLFKEKCINEIEENIIQTVDQYLEAPESMAELVIKVKNAVNRLGCILVENILNSLDHGLRTSRERKQEWNIKETESRKLLTSMGEIRFSHTLFCDKTGGESVYLLDELIGIGKDQRMTEDAEALVYLNGAADPYQRTGRMIAEGTEVSAQTVMNKVHSLRFPKEEPVKRKREVEYLYIEADEAHVPLQYREKRGDLRKEKYGGRVLAKLVYVHEGVRSSSPAGGRRQLVHPHYFSGVYEGKENRKLWKEVWEWIKEHYDVKKIRKIYLNSDGGSWILGARKEIKEITSVLDEFHLSEYLLKMTAFLLDSASEVQEELRGAIREGNREKFDGLTEKILRVAESESSRRRIIESAEYIRSSWMAAKVRLSREEGVVGSSTEGHVSHLLSARMSSRPMGWSKTGVDKMCRLRAYLKNGGNVLELAKYQHRTDEEAEEKRAAGAEGIEIRGLSCTEILRSEKGRIGGIGKYFNAILGKVDAEIMKQGWYKSCFW